MDARGNLTLTRKRGQTIEIPSLGITIRLVSNQPAKICVTAPKTAQVLRGELLGNPPRSVDTDGESA